MNKKPYQTNRSRDYYRYQRERSIERKYQIRVNQWGSQSAYKNVKSQPNIYGQLNKGKVHCGCGICASKTKIRGYKKQERSKLDSMLKDINNFDFE